MKAGWWIIIAIVAAAGCNSNQQPVEKFQGRSETRKLEGASAVGYDGTAIRKNVDKTLDRTDQHGQDLDRTPRSSETQK